MKKVILLMALLAPGAGQATAQSAAMHEDIRAACMSDYRRFCFGVMPGGGGALKSCLNQHKAKFSPGCAAILANANGRRTWNFATVDCP